MSDEILKETDYQKPIASAWWRNKNEGIVLERIRTKERGVEEIRLAWWKDGRMIPRPADLDAVDWVPLFREAIRNGVFTAEEQLGMLRALLRETPTVDRE